MKICIVVGTRPEIIKTSPLLRACESRKLDYFLLHTGQHYSYNMDRLFFEELSLPAPKYNLHAGVPNFGLQIGTILTKLQDILRAERPDIVLLQGDTNSVLAGALAASKVGVQVGHVEAGLRSFDISMAEELNRILTDHLSEYLFAPTPLSKKNLLEENLREEKIFVTGNTVVDAVNYNLEIARKRSSALETLGLERQAYFLLTLHRAECVDNKTRLTMIAESIERLSHFGLPIICPVHPRARKMLKLFNLEQQLRDIKNFRMIEPVGYLDFLLLEEQARLILTDAGGVQEEACILKVPCITLRENTERQETVRLGCNMLAGYKPDNILNAVAHLLERDRDWKNPFGDGKAAEEILRIVDAQ